MNLEAVIVLVFIGYLKKTLTKFSPNEEWNIVFQGAIYAGIGLLIIEMVFDLKPITAWVWILVEVIIVALTFRLEMFAPARKLLIGLIPLMFISFLINIFRTLFPDSKSGIEKFFSIAMAISITWLVAMIYISNKERKAMEKDRQKRLIEEERHKLIEEKKNELEGLVAQRTLEITRQKDELENALLELQSAQKQLIQAEKMASLGELTAGIAHEIQNPLNFVNNFSEVSVELVNELKDEIMAGNTSNVVEIASDIEKNLQKITHHGKRADAIVKGMLQHSRTSTGAKESADINALADEYLRLSYHGLRAKDKNFNASMHTAYDEAIGMIDIIPQDIGRVLLNLYTNAFYSVFSKKKMLFDKNVPYEPMVSVETRLLKNAGEQNEDVVWICIKDNGLGIPKKVLDKIYQPFFTTKPSGEGTGLGLSLSYDIIHKGHGGKMTVETKEGEFAEFIIELPVIRSV